jgi:hypothetical protein
MSMSTIGQHTAEAEAARMAAGTLRKLIAAERARPTHDQGWLIATQDTIAKLDRQASAANTALARDAADMHGDLDRLGVTLTAPPRPSWGATFTTSPQWRNRTGFTCAPVALGGYLEERTAAGPLAPGAAGGGLGPVASRCGIIPAQPVHVTLLRWQGPLVPAQPQGPEPPPPAQPPLKAPGGQAPVITPVIAPTIASWISATRQLLDDHATLAALIDGRLRLALALALDNAIVDAITGDADVPPADSVLAAVGELSAEGHGGNLTVITDPAGFATVDTVGLLALGVTAILASNQVTAGTAIVASLGAGVQLRTVGAAQVLVTDSHAATFLNNELTLLAEQRVASGVADPWALRIVGGARSAGKRAA